MKEDAETPRSPSAYRGVRVLVTGAAGFVGRWVCLALDRAGAELHATARDRKALERTHAVWGIRAKPLICDLRDPDSFAEAFRDARPAIVFHAAGYGVEPSERDDETMRQVNVHLADCVARVTASNADDSGWPGLRLVNVGSAFEYGIREGTLTESTEPIPDTPYGRTKLEGTRRVQAARTNLGLRSGTARLTTVYGPGEHPHRLFPSLLRAAETREPLKLTGGKQERDFTWVGDVAEGLLQIGTLPDLPDGVVNLATGKLRTVRSFVEIAREVLRIPADLLLLGAIPYRDDEVWQGPVDVSRLESLLGWRPATGIREGIAASSDFLHRHAGAAH